MKKFQSETISEYKLRNRELQRQHKEKVNKDLDEQGEWDERDLEERYKDSESLSLR